MLMNISLKKRTLLVLLSGLTATFTLAQQQPLPEWQSQYAVGLNKLAPHTYVWPYANASDIEKPGGYEQSPFYMSLNGKWKFHWVKNPDKRPKEFYKPSFYTGGEYYTDIHRVRFRLNATYPDTPDKNRHSSGKLQVLSYSLRLPVYP